MRLSDIVSNLDLSIYPQVALLIFVATFIAISIRTLRRSRREMDAHARLPIDDDRPGD